MGPLTEKQIDSAVLLLANRVDHGQLASKIQFPAPSGAFENTRVVTIMDGTLH